MQSFDRRIPRSSDSRILWPYLSSSFATHCRESIARVGLLCLSVTLLPSCAAAFRGSKATIHVNSEPADAEVSVGGRTVGVTPGEAEVPRQGPSIVHVRKDGYAQSEFVLDRSVNAGWVVWDVATCVIPVMLCIPLLVDGVSGAWIDVDEQYKVRLIPETPVPSPRAPRRQAAPAPTTGVLPAQPIVTEGAPAQEDGPSEAVE
jgi:hypothetical protein